MSQWSNEEIQEVIAEGACCLGEKNKARILSEQNGEDAECLTNEALMLVEWIDSLGRFTAVGTILYYNNAVCANIDLTEMLDDLANGETVNIVINAPSGDITIVTFTGDFAGMTLSQFIQEIVDQITDNAPTGYTATNANPNLNLCFTGVSVDNLVGSTIQVQLASRWYLKWTESNTRRAASTTLGYGSISAVRPSYVADTTPPKLFVPNGDGVASIATTQNFDGVATGAAGRTATLLPNLSALVFANGELCYFTKTVGNLLYTIQATITAYNSGTGVITFTVGVITQQDLTTGIVTTINPMTALGLGNTSWTWNDSGHGWSTVSIYTCNLITGDLTYVTDTQIPVRLGAGGGMSFYSSILGFVYIIGYGASLSHGSIIKINPTTNAVAASLDFGITGANYIFLNPSNNTIYCSFESPATLAKVDVNLNYDNTKNIAPLNVGAMTWQSDGIVYTAPRRGSRLIVTKGDDAGTAWNITEPPQLPLFTPTDFTLNAPNPLTADFNGAAATNGLSNQLINIGAGLDGLGLFGANLIWVNNAAFVWTRLDTVNVPNRLYVINGTVNSYNNVTGILDYDITTVVYWHTPATIGLGTMVGASGAINFSPASGTWNWYSYPAIRGAIEMYYHENSPNPRMFITRLTTIGGTLQSWDISSGVEATILATQQTHYPPNYPTTVLSGNMNWQSGIGKMILPSSSGQESWVFDPDTLTFDPSPISHPAVPISAFTPPFPDSTGGGIQTFSITGDVTDPLNPNLYATTPNGNEIGVVSFLEGLFNQFLGRFTGTATAVVSSSSQNCIETPDKLVTNIKQACGCCNHEERTVTSEQVQLILAANGGSALDSNGNYIPVIP